MLQQKNPESFREAVWDFAYDVSGILVRIRQSIIAINVVSKVISNRLNEGSNVQNVAIMIQKSHVM